MSTARSSRSLVRWYREKCLTSLPTATSCMKGSSTSSRKRNA
nr:hypothetical protein [uncultured Acetatifactor sp.]